MKKLEIGSGSKPLEGYIHLNINPKAPHVDIIANAEKIPCPDNEFDEIVANHILEHIIWHKSEAVLAEWYRVLKPKGIIKICVPNLDWIIDLYKDPNRWKTIKGHPYSAKENKLDMVNHYLYGTSAVHNQHQRAFNAEHLYYLLMKVGLKNIHMVENMYLTVTAEK